MCIGIWDEDLPVISSLEDDVPASTATARAAVTMAGFGGCLCFRRRRHRNRRTRSRIKNNAHPTTIPTIAPVDRPLDFFSFCGSSDAGDGDGGTKNGLHGRNGPPQRSRFPENADAGNFDKLSGMEPLSLLFDTLNPTSSDVMLGRLPEKLLFCRNSPVKRVKLLIAKGIGPEKVFDEISSRDKWLKLGTNDGNSPERALFWR